MLHGFALHANGRVAIAEEGKRLVLAQVSAGDGDPRGRVENVRLEARSERLVVGCSCPARSLGLSTCKHTWAVLLEADLRCALDDLRGSGKPLHVDAIDLPPPQKESEKPLKKEKEKEKEKEKAKEEKKEPPPAKKRPSLKRATKKPGSRPELASARRKTKRDA